MSTKHHDAPIVILPQGIDDNGNPTHDHLEKGFNQHGHHLDVNEQFPSERRLHEGHYDPRRDVEKKPREL